MIFKSQDHKIIVLSSWDDAIHSLCLHQETATKKPLIATNNAQNSTKLNRQYKLSSKQTWKHSLLANYLYFLVLFSLWLADQESVGRKFTTSTAKKLKWLQLQINSVPVLLVSQPYLLQCPKSTNVMDKSELIFFYFRTKILKADCNM